MRGGLEIQKYEKPADARSTVDYRPAEIYSSIKINNLESTMRHESDLKEARLLVRCEKEERGVNCLD